MPVTARRLATLAAPLLLAGSLSSCSAFGGSPTDASVEDFCDAREGLYEALFGSITPGEQPDGAELYDDLQEAIDEIAEVGTPEDIPDDAREGFEIQVDSSREVDEDEFVDAVDSQDPDAFEDSEDLSEEDQDKVATFESYATEQCGDPGQELLEDLDLPESPEDLEIPESPEG